MILDTNQNYSAPRYSNPAPGFNSLSEIQETSDQLRESEAIPFLGCLFIVVAITFVSCCGIALLVFSL